MIKLIRFLGYATAALVLTSCGKPDQVPSATEALEGESKGFLKVNFNSNVERLEPHFKGHDWREFPDFYSKTQLKREAGESLTTFNDRRRLLWKDAIYADVKADGTLAIAGAVNKKYNEKTGVLSITKATTVVPWTDEPIHYVFSNKLPPDTREEKTTESTVSDVASRDEFYFGIRPIGKSYKKVALKNQPVKLKLTKDQAKEIVESEMNAVYIGRLAFPNFFDLEERTVAATSRSPIERNVEIDVLNLKIESVWLVNEKTGEIISKQF